MVNNVAVVFDGDAVASVATADVSSTRANFSHYYNYHESYLLNLAIFNDLQCNSILLYNMVSTTSGSCWWATTKRSNMV